jgi:hypothetical protein
MAAISPEDKSITSPLSGHSAEINRVTKNGLDDSSKVRRAKKEFAKKSIFPPQRLNFLLYGAYLHVKIAFDFLNRLGQCGYSCNLWLVGRNYFFLNRFRQSVYSCNLGLVGEN